MKQSIGLGIIVKASAEEAKPLERLLESVYQHVDEIQMTVTGVCKEVEEIGEKYGANITHFTWVDDFAAARTFNREQVKSDWYFWLDADDTFTFPERLHTLVDQGKEQNVSGFFFQYQYDFDENGFCVDAHWKAQLLKNDKSWDWKGAIHEDALPNCPVNWVKSDACVRIHHSDTERKHDSSERNLRILLAEHKKNPIEPRTLFYLGRAYIVLGKFQEATDALLEYLTMSGWAEERYEARMLIGECLFKTKQFDEALKCYNDAILEKEEYGDAYIKKASTYLMLGDWNKALYNYKISLQMQEGDGAVSFNPMIRRRDVYLGIAVAYMNLGKLVEAKQAMDTALKVDPKNVNALEIKGILEPMLARYMVANNYKNIARSLRDSGQESKILPLLHSFPRELMDNEIYLSLKHTYLPPKKWEKDSIVIYCGSSAEPFTPSMQDGRGLGGSETAVVELAAKLRGLGWKVTVYNECNAPEDGMTVNGVVYENYWKFNPNDNFDVLWVWRLPELFDYDLNARVRLLDLHDVMTQAQFTPERVAKMDKIFVKTEYHRSLFPLIPDDKFVIIGNGINLGRFRNGEKFQRNPHRFIYASTPNRGLDVVLDIWGKIRVEFPDAELHTYYGWESFAKIEKNNPERMKWMESMKKRMQAPGIVNHGRLGQKELAEHEMQTSFWLYPTNFPEIHCITACEMQAAGVIPLTSGYAALAETQKAGLKLPGDTSDPSWQDRYIKEVIAWVKDNERCSGERMKGIEAAKEFSWSKVAEKWDKALK